MRSFVLLLLTALLAWAGVTHEPVTPSFLDKKIKIIDIRTATEWSQTGIVKNSIPLTFFDERNQYNINAFLKALDSHVKKGETFALICRTGSRSQMVANFLGKNGYNVIDLQGGVMAAQRQGVKLIPYAAK
ncbi:MAG: hypothetical protein KU37_02540 [Sulfuricurvum sp. PC08-66]|nr:MAG: hypothetical protein KU37_02540 [Sulfuricurvum sp. PC08-66]